MKRRLIISLLLSMLLPLAVSAASVTVPQVDTSDKFKYAKLDSLLAEFYSALEREDVEVKGREFDNIISTCQDSLTRQHVALHIFDHYRFSRIMGEEAVALHVYDEWIASGKVSTRSEFEQMDAELFAEFNRYSLLGMKAVPVALRKPCGGKMTIPVEGRKGILFFYDTSCAKCRLESAVLPAVLDKVDFPVDFYAVYVGEDKTDWRAFRKNFKLHNRQVRMFHLWDPEMDSGYQKYYGVTGTPKMFVVLEDGEILGRRLEVTNLEEIIHYISIANGKKE